MTEPLKKSSIRVVAVSSGGGHWVELMRLIPAFYDTDVSFVTVNQSYHSDVSEFANAKFYCVQDVTRWNKILWIKTAFQLFFIIIKEHPHYVISTGALPGYLALRIGKLFGSKTIWIDSIANANKLSSSGEHIGKHADLWLTQWKHLSKHGGPEYHGAVL